MNYGAQPFKFSLHTSGQSFAYFGFSQLFTVTVFIYTMKNEPRQ